MLPRRLMDQNGRGVDRLSPAEIRAQLQYQQQLMAASSHRRSPSNGAHMGSPLHSSVDAKLQAICDTLSNPEKQGSAPLISAATEEAGTNGEFGTSGLEDTKSDISSSLEEDESSSSGSSAVSAMQYLDFTEAPWDESDSFVLRKYPSWEIDWDSVLSSD